MGVLLLVTTGVLGCGGGVAGGGAVVSDVNEDDERVPIAATFDEVRTSVEDASPAGICAGLGPRARDQLSQLGHGSNGCAKGVAMLLKGLGKGPRGQDRLPRSSVTDVDVKVSATVKVDVADRTIRVPFVVEDGRWKLDSFYGLSPRPSVAIP